MFYENSITIDEYGDTMPAFFDNKLVEYNEQLLVEFQDPPEGYFSNKVGPAACRYYKNLDSALRILELFCEEFDGNRRISELLEANDYLITCLFYNLRNTLFLEENMKRQKFGDQNVSISDQINKQFADLQDWLEEESRKTTQYRYQVFPKLINKSIQNEIKSTENNKQQTTSSKIQEDIQIENDEISKLKTQMDELKLQFQVCTVSIENVKINQENKQTVRSDKKENRRSLKLINTNCNENVFENQNWKIKNFYTENIKTGYTPNIYCLARPEGSFSYWSQQIQTGYTRRTEFNHCS